MALYNTQNIENFQESQWIEECMEDLRMGDLMDLIIYGIRSL